MRRGFTLLELLLVLAIIGLVAAIVSARLNGMRTTHAVDQAAQQIVDQALRCRHLATARGVNVRLRIDTTDKTATVQMLTAQVASDPPDALPVQVQLYEGVDELTATFLRDDGVSLTDRVIEVLFRPDARCTPSGLLTLTCHDQQAAVRYPSSVRPALREAVVRP